MSKGILVSEKHGVNPTILRCFWCGKEKNEIALLGKLPNDQEAPRSTWMNGDYEPCDACKGQFDQGILIMEADCNPVIDGQAPIQKGIYPTGDIVVLTESGARKVFNESSISDVLKKRKCFMDRKTFSMFGNLKER